MFEIFLESVIAIIRHSGKLFVSIIQRMLSLNFQLLKEAKAAKDASPLANSQAPPGQLPKNWVQGETAEGEAARIRLLD
jgi:hypothetical protein